MRKPREAEVGDDDPPRRLLHEDVPRRQVTVDDSPFVRIRECRRDRNGDLDGLIPAQGPSTRDLGEARPLDQFHDEKRRLAVVAVVVQPHDVLVLERCQQPRLAVEPAREILVFCDPGVKNLDRHFASETPVVGPPDGSHPASADARSKLVAAGEKDGHGVGNRPFRVTNGTNRLKL